MNSSHTENAVATLKTAHLYSTSIMDGITASSPVVSITDHRNSNLLKKINMLKHTNADREEADLVYSPELKPILDHRTTPIELYRCTHLK